MKYINEYRSNTYVKTLVEAINNTVSRSWNIMELCGGQTHAIARYRIEDILPKEIVLLHGPGCPVCVTPVETIDFAIEIAKQKNVIFTSFGDMMRVPGSKEDLLSIKAEGADVRMMYSPLHAIELAIKNPDKDIVFFAIGFETTAPIYTTVIREAERKKLKNFFLLTSLFTVPPAIEMILNDPENKVDAFLTAGHVCAITGNEPYHKLAIKYNKPMVITGFEPVDLLYGIYKCVIQLENGLAIAENAYKRAVKEEGNQAIKLAVKSTFKPFDQEWRGIGFIPNSGIQLQANYSEYDAVRKFSLLKNKINHLIIEDKLANTCIMGEIMKGNKQVTDCAHFGTTCNPQNPLGASMVSSEGACAAYCNYKQL